jgi:hypothetical protein
MNEVAVKNTSVHLQFYAPRESHTLSNNVLLILMFLGIFFIYGHKFSCGNNECNLEKKKQSVNLDYSLYDAQTVLRLKIAYILLFLAFQGI